MTTINFTLTMCLEECAACSMTYAVPAGFQAERQKDHRSFYCPVGHRQNYTGETEEQKLRTKLASAQQRETRLTARLDQERAAVEHQKARANGYKGALTKVKKRIGKGVCPACNRHFPNVEDHMAAKHPELADQAADLEAGKPA